MTEDTSNDRGDLLRGTLEMLILRTLLTRSLHGYGITEIIRFESGQVLEIDEGSMYPALYRMQKRGWVSASWGRSENNRRAKYYTLTDEGRRQFESAKARWVRFCGAVDQVVEVEPA